MGEGVKGGGCFQDPHTLISHTIEVMKGLAGRRRLAGALGVHQGLPVGDGAPPSSPQLKDDVTAPRVAEAALKPVHTHLLQH